MVLCVVISEVILSSFPMDVEMSLAYSIPDPIEPHVNSFRSLLLDSVIDDAFCTRVVSLNWSWGLLMTKKFQGCSQCASILGIVAVSYTHLTLPTNREV